MTGDRSKTNTIMVNREFRIESGETTSGGDKNVKMEKQSGYNSTLENGRA